MAVADGPTCQQLTGCVGGLIEGIDITRPLSPDDTQFIRSRLVDLGVVFFRNQHLSDAQMHAFASSFAPPIAEPFAPSDADRSPVTEGDMQPTQRATSVWHADTTFVTEPPRFTVLRAARLPSFGGDTCWASMHAAYDALSAPMQRMLEGLTAVHSIAPVMQRMGVRAEGHAAGSAPRHGTANAHPVVISHPETGRKALYVSQAWVTDIVELTPEESAHVLALLFEHVKLPDFAVRWRWSVNDVAIWDNRAVQHYAVPDYCSERVMQRVVTAGERPQGVG